MKFLRVLGVLLVVVLAAAAALAQETISFQRIATTNTTVPGGTGQFITFSAGTSLSDGYVAFRGNGNSNQAGIYLGTSETSLAVVADKNTSIPGGIGNFTNFNIGEFGNKGSTVAFSNNGDGRPGIYLAKPSQAMTALVNYTTPMQGPGTSGNFNVISNLSMQGTKVAFSGGQTGVPGVYTTDLAGNVTFLANIYTNRPQGGGTIGTAGRPAIAGEQVTFATVGAGLDGLYKWTTANGLQKVADTSTAIPSGTGNFSNFTAPRINTTDIVFGTVNASSQGIGLFRAASNGTLSVIANTSTAVPGGTGNITNIGTYSISDRLVLFNASAAGGQQGLYYSLDGGAPKKLLAHNDVFDGDVVGTATVSPGGADGLSVAFRVVYAGGGEGIYTATIAVPEPSTYLALSVTGLAGVFWLRRNRRSK